MGDGTATTAARHDEGKAEEGEDDSRVEHATTVATPSVRARRQSSRQPAVAVTVIVTVAGLGISGMLPTRVAEYWPAGNDGGSTGGEPTQRSSDDREGLLVQTG